MRRFFTEPENINNGIAVIVEDASHINKVLRMKPGDEILIFDGSGREYTAKLRDIASDKCEAELISCKMSEQEPSVKVTIFQGLPKTGKMEGIIQKSVELGAFSVVPVSMDRCVTKLDGGKKEADKLRRWNKVSVEAAKQCGRGILPEVHSCVAFKQAIDMMKQNELAIMPYEMLGHLGDFGLKDAISGTLATSIGVMIGPEGGFSDSEAEYAKENGIKLVGLGKRILRTETVSGAILAAIMYEMS